MKTKNILITAVILMTAVQAGCEHQEGPLEDGDGKKIAGGKSGGASTGGTTTGGTTTGGTTEILPGGGTPGGTTTGGTTTGGTTTGGTTTGGTTTGGTTTGGTTTGGTTTGGTTGGGTPAKICAAGVSAGGDHTCARGSDGSLRCWGSNFFGQLGNGLEGLDGEGDEAVGHHSSIPVEVSTLGSGVSEVAAGRMHHTCARKIDGSLWCWGYNSFGKLGDGTKEARLTPFGVSAASTPNKDWTEVSAGVFHTCARKVDGSLWCWGRNDHGQLGDGTKNEKLEPFKVGALTTWAEVSVSAGGSHTCARRTDGSLWCWGYNGMGQLGNGTEDEKLEPFQAGASLDWAEVSAGAYHTCARKTDGSLWCWGYNDMGQLGNGTKDKKKEPFQVGMLKDWTEVSAGLAHTCARKTDGSLWCWGRNDLGQVGNESVVGISQTSPIQVDALGTEVAEVSAGKWHTCARKTDGSLWCWGANASGQLGDGKTENTKKPVQVQYFCQ